MADKPEMNIAAAWQQFVGQWERQVNELSATVSGNEMFAGPMNQATKVSLAARASLDGVMEKLLEGMRVASQTQMIEVIERLDRIEELLTQLTTRAAAPAAPPPVAEPRRTRRPPAA